MPVPKSPNHKRLICVKKPTRISHAWAPLSRDKSSTTLIEWKGVIQHNYRLQSFVLMRIKSVNQRNNRFLDKFKEINTLITVTVLFLFAFVNLILDALIKKTSLRITEPSASRISFTPLFHYRHFNTKHVNIQN